MTHRFRHPSIELNHCCAAAGETMTPMMTTIRPTARSTASAAIMTPRTQYCGTMMVLRTSILLLLLVLLNSSFCLAQNEDTNTNTCSSSSGSGGATDAGSCQEQPTKQQHQCSLYMAESTIPHAGLGIFTGVPRKPGDTVGNGDVLIPVIDLWYHMDAPASEEKLDPTSDYIWHGPEMGMQQETTEPNEHVSAFAPGLDAAINCHLGLINVDKNVPSYDVSGLHRSRDPGAGAITPYHNCTTSVIHDIPAGGELFKDYGDHWFESRPYAFSTLPLRQDYPKAELLVKSFYNRMTAFGLSEQVLRDLWQLMTEINGESRILNALPKEYEAVSFVAKHGLRAYYQPSGTKSLEDLQKTGRCLDIVKPAKSTIPQAGRGLFATQLLPAGSIVAGTPLLQVQEPLIFEMYNGDWYDKDEEPNRDELVGYQIMMNYCWKHNQGSHYFCPYGAGVNYVNHGSNTGSSSSNYEANVRLQWAADGVMGHKESWLSRPTEEMGYNASPGLFMDLVATRNILPGEELFMDYGRNWEEAWEEHLENWYEKEHSHPSDYQSARDWNKENGQTVLRTDFEQEGLPYPSHMELRCLGEIYENLRTKHAEAARQWTLSESGIPCFIFDRREATEDDSDEDNDHYYKVTFAPKVWSEETEYYEEGDEWYESDWIVRGALSFVDVPYSTDMFLGEAFRHPIGFPDDIFPDAWRNEKGDMEEEEEEEEDDEEEEEEEA